MVRRFATSSLAACSLLWPAMVLQGQAQSQGQAQQTKEGAASHDEITPKDRIAPADLASALQKSATPLIFQVGPRTFFDQAHIVGAEYVGAAGTEAGLAALRDRVKSVEKDRWIVVYCGCCPWDRCPNIRPAFHELQSLGFTHVQALDLPTSFGADWVAKGLPIEQ